MWKTQGFKNQLYSKERPNFTEMLSKRTLLLLSALFALILVLAFYFFRQAGGPRKRDDLFQFVDSRAALMLQLKLTSDKVALIRENEVYGNLISSELKSDLRIFDSLLSYNNLYEGLWNKEVLLSLQKVSARSSKALLIVPIEKELGKIMNAELLSSGSQRDLASEKIYALPFMGTTVYMVGLKKYALITQDLPLLESSILNQKRKSSLLQNTSMQQWLAQENPEAEIGYVFVNYESLPSFSALWFETEFNKGISHFADKASFSVFQLNFSANNINLNGELLCKPENYFKALQNQQEGQSLLLNSLSSNTWAFESFVWSDPEKFRFENASLQRLNRDFSYEAEMKSLQKKLGVDLSTWLNKYFGNEDLRVYSKAWSPESTTEEYYLSLLKDGFGMSEYFKKNYKEAQRYRNTIVYQFPLRKIHYLLAGNTFKHSDVRYAAIIEDRMVSANSQSAVTRYIDDVMNASFLKDDPNFKEFKASINDSYNYLLVAGIKGNEDLISQLLLDSNSNARKDNNFYSYSGIASMVAGSDAGLIHSFYISNAQEDSLSKLAPDWQVSISAGIKGIYSVLQNAKPSVYALVQDDSNMVSLLHSNSKIIWKQAVEDGIIGDAFLVDYYKNGNLQVLFSATNKIYLIDLLGKPVANYPIRLPSTATQGLSLFDYDQSKNYRYFIACENGNVYGYDLSARPLDGWNPKKLGKLQEPLQFYRVAGKDILLARNDQNVFYVLNRKGEELKKFSEDPSVRLSSNFYFVAGDSWEKSKLHGSTADGNLLVFDLLGNRDLQKADSLSEYHFYSFADVVGGSDREQIILDGKKIRVTGKDTSSTFEFDVPTEIFNQAIIAASSKGGLLFVYVKESDLLYHFNRQGKLAKQFPVKASSAPIFMRQGAKFGLLLKGEGQRLWFYSVQ